MSEGYSDVGFNFKGQEDSYGKIYFQKAIICSPNIMGYYNNNILFNEYIAGRCTANKYEAFTSGGRT
jgi:hypothetical protein